jgi:murein DD-endopeptidase
MKAALTVLLLIGVFVVPNCTVHAQLGLPLRGSQNVDWFLVNYVDHDSTKPASNYRCDWQTYHAHQGSDFVLRDFRQMDSGVVVMAAADGVVAYIIDTFYDRSKQELTGGYGNYILLKHADSLYTIYAHLRKKLQLVQLGTKVRKGEALGLVGSSGRASDPHVHFEVYKNGLLVDPFGDECRGTGAPIYFDNRPAYDSDFMMIAGGVMGTIPTLDSIREHPRDRLTFYGDKDSTIGMWVHGLTVKRGDSVRVEWRTPDSTLWYQYKSTYDTNIRYWYWWSYIDGPKKQTSMPAGIWTVRWFHNANTIPSYEKQFTIAVTGEVSRDLASAFEMSPNPANAFISIRGEGLTNAYLSDLLGARIDAPVNASGSVTTFDVKRLPSGVYFVHALHKGEWSSERILIQH